MVPNYEIKEGFSIIALFVESVNYEKVGRVVDPVWTPVVITAWQVLGSIIEGSV